MKNKTGQTFVFGAVILMASNIISKVIGAFLKIPLMNLIGAGAMAYYSAAYNVYAWLFMVSTAGIPVAISRMIATANTAGNKREVKRIFNVAMAVFFGIGVTATLIMALAAKSFTKFSELPDAYLAIIVIAPTLFFICISSAYRGFFQGLSNMVPTAVSQVIEAVGKMSIGLIAGYICVKRGESDAVVAAYVIGGVTIGVAAAAIYAAICKRMYNVANRDSENYIPKGQKLRPIGEIFKELCIVAIPIALSSSIMGLTGIIDIVLVTKRLITTGILRETAVEFYGNYTAMSMTFFNFAPILIYPFAIAAIPVITSALEKKSYKTLNTTMSSLFRVTSIIAFPCAFGLCGMAGPILKMFYRNPAVEGTGGAVKSIDIAAPALSVLGVAIFFVAIISVTNSILQAWKYERLPIYSTVFGIIVKIISEYILMGIPNFGVLGAAVSTLLCYFTIMAFNMYFVTRYVRFIPGILTVFAKPFISATACGIGSVLVNNTLTSLIGESKLITLLSVMVAAVIYLVMLILLKGFSEDDIMLLPKGEKICRMLKKIHAI